MFRAEGEISHLTSACHIDGTPFILQSIKILVLYFITKETLSNSQLMGLLVFFPPQQENQFLKTNYPLSSPDYYVTWEMAEQRQGMITKPLFYSALKYICGITVSRKTKRLAQNWEKCKWGSLSLTPDERECCRAVSSTCALPSLLPCRLLSPPSQQNWWIGKI